jgi:hypothetical protein
VEAVFEDQENCLFSNPYLSLSLSLLFLNGPKRQKKTFPVDKILLIGLKMGRVFKSRSGCMYVMRLLCNIAKLSNFKLKTRPKQLLGYLPLAFVLLALPILSALNSKNNIFLCSQTTLGHFLGWKYLVLDIRSSFSILE